MSGESRSFALVVALVLASCGAEPPQERDAAATPPAPRTPPAPSQAPDAGRPPARPGPSPLRSKDAFVGNGACKKCHFAQHRTWTRTKLAKSLAALKPSAAGDPLESAKSRAGLDPARDYSADAQCLPCHTTGYGARGGYPADPTEEGAAARAALFGKVSCEACHGPGERYVKFKSDALAAAPDAKFAPEQLAPLGLVKPGAAACADCHNASNPTHASDAFDFGRDKSAVHPTPGK